MLLGAVVNTPLPQSLAEECKKAARILRSFNMDKVSSGGVDRIIPPTLIARAKGLAILSVIKAGFLVTARAGTGIVVAKCSDGSKLIYMTVCRVSLVSLFFLRLGSGVVFAVGNVKFGSD